MRWRPPTTSLVCLAAVLALLGTTARGATLRVPSEYATIQSGIDAAASGDTVLIEPGEYSEYVARSIPGFGTLTAMGFLKDGVVIRGEGGAENTVLRHSPSSGSYAFNAYALTTETTRIEGMSITGDAGLPRGGVVLLQGRKLTVEQCAFRGLALAIESYHQGVCKRLKAT